jgi:diguanylate cyclase (GGDEF)-like protein
MRPLPDRAFEPCHSTDRDGHHIIRDGPGHRKVVSPSWPSPYSRLPLPDNVPDAPLVLAADKVARFRSYLDAHNGYRKWLYDWLLGPVTSTLDRLVPAQLSETYAECGKLVSKLDRGLATPADLPLVRRAALHCRQQVALRQEQLHATNVDAAHSQEIDALITDVEADLRGLCSVRPSPRPRLTDFVNLRTARNISRELGTPQPFAIERTYDEKFGILWGPKSFSEVIQACRHESWLLRTSTCVAYLDIDNFKQVNSDLSETVVDRRVLPPFMLLLEAHTSSRGFAFREGGDEYVLVLPNVDRDEASRFLEKLRGAVASTPFGSRSLTVSIGGFVVTDDCPLTSSEARKRANEAKNEAKKQISKNCVLMANDNDL